MAPEKAFVPEFSLFIPLLQISRRPHANLCPNEISTTRKKNSQQAAVASRAYGGAEMRNVFVCLVLSCVFCAFSVEAARADVIATGTITNWMESANQYKIGDGTHTVTLQWSFAGNPTYMVGWFYGSEYASDSDVAYANVTDILQITDANTLSFSNIAVGPYGAGSFVVWKNINTGYFGALRIDSITYDSASVYHGHLNATWWFADASGNFAPSSAVPEPTSLLLLGSGFAGLLGRRKMLRR